jgi:alkane 1-monooxygenase
VATREDPATARFGESFYHFYPRALLGSFRSAWRLDAGRLRRSARHPLGWHNQMLWFIGVPLLIVAALWVAFGPRAALFFLGQSAMAFTVLEAINYLQIYGLVRERHPDGRIESVTHRHSWNASEAVTNCCLINLQRHADHHDNPGRPYQALRHHDGSPQLPTGYAGMLLVALVPPLWFKIMNPRVARLHGEAVRPALSDAVMTMPR